MSITIEIGLNLMITCNPNLNTPQILLVNFHFYIVNVLSKCINYNEVCISFKIADNKRKWVKIKI